MDALQVIAEPRRRQILRLVWDRELAAGEIASRFDVSFAAVSQHLAVLRSAGFVDMRPDGRSRLYRANPKALGPLRATLESMWSASLDRVVELIESGEQ